MGSNKVLIAGRSINGLFMKEGPPNFTDYEPFPKIETGRSKCMAWSCNGKYIAFNNGTFVKVMRIPECQTLLEINYPRTVGLCFSPLGNMLATWEPHTAPKDADDPGFNLRIFQVETGQCVKGLHQKRQIGWQPQWTVDEQLVARMVNNEVHFYENNNFDNIARKIHLNKVAEFKLSPGKPKCHVTCFVRGGVSGQPSSIKLYCYPNFDNSNAVIASKSFFKADKVDMKWNASGTACLALLSVDSDKSGASYYGEQTLHLLTIKGNSFQVQLAKNGPIYSVEWNPDSSEFCVVYGFMPAKATLFNLEAEAVFDFGTSPRNLVYYNNHGNLLILAGFGNLNGHVEIWDLRRKKEIVRTLARDTTYLEWCPDGEHFMTATLSPRLRVGNGYKIWHYTGKTIHEFGCNKDEELWEVLWRPFSGDEFKEKNLVYNVAQTMALEKPTEIYRPPAARGISGISSAKFHEDYEKPSNLKEHESASKLAVKNKKKREARKAKKDMEDTVKEEKEEHVGKVSELPTCPVEANRTLNDPESEKKMKNLLKKLEQIRILRQQQDSGKLLEKNQLEKIKKEKELLDELASLK